VLLSRQDLPVEALADAANDRVAEIRALVAANPATPSDTLVRLGGDRRVSVRAKVVDNPGTPLSVLRSLGSDPVLDVRIAARRVLRQRAGRC
jgi:hypothetical protein